MRHEIISPAKTRKTLNTVTLAVGLMLLPLAPMSQGAGPASPDRNARAFLQQLDTQQRAELQESIRASLVRKAGVNGPPDYLRYQSALLAIVLNPSLSAGLSPADREQIEQLPAGNDRRFIRIARQEMSSACRVIEKLSASNAAAAAAAANAFNRARQSVRRKINGFYRNRINRLSREGRRVVQTELDRQAEQEFLVHAELDFNNLGFNQPEYVVVFLRDTCLNSTSVLAEDHAGDLTIKDQLLSELNQEVTNIFQPN